MERKSLAEKIIVLGIDGMDPKFAKDFWTRTNYPISKKCWQWVQRGKTL